VSWENSGLPIGCREHFATRTPLTCEFSKAIGRCLFIGDRPGEARTGLKEAPVSRRTVLSVVMTVIAAAAAFGGLRPAAAVDAAAPVRIMPLGDSITAGPGCWRAMLWNKLQNAGYTNIDFVGSQPGGGCAGPAYDVDHEGHGGYSATGIASQNQLPAWLSAASPNVVIMHLGTNDTWGGYIPLADKLAAFTTLVGQMRANNPDMRIVVAQIIPMEPPGCTTCPGDVVALNNAIPGWAAGLSTTRSPITVADLWTGFNAATDTGDGVHPNDAGFQKMANAWYPALVRALGGVAPSSPGTSPSRTASASASRTASASPSRSSASPSGGTGGCTATHTVVSQWQSGFQGEVKVTNTGTTAGTGWTVTLTYPGGQRITQAWSATVSGTAPATATNVSYNGALPPGGSTTFGFLADGAGATPTLTCTLR
jgi:lysophospholipase L1-like esterase